VNLWQRLTREGATRQRFGTERERRPAWVDRLIKIGLALSLVIVSVPLFPLQRTLDTPRFELEKVTHEQVIAPFSFDILKTDEELERERDEAVRDVAPVFNVDESRAELARRQLSRFQTDIQQVAANANLSRSERMDMIARLGLNLMPVSRRVLANPTRPCGSWARSVRSWQGYRPASWPRPTSRTWTGA
jgi:membrane-associated HD superfamily phosphohydrolase